ncbi:hypothetical protein [Cellulomonas sp. URHE0023]|uniref:hypothetical protein n=1 Tax=Cellulomonas sp. URHE0023 TaxID=1380354 RepID=UPI000AAF3350|nr:hypothetical protein [Cellulomonas sp. URHE0023]
MADPVARAQDRVDDLRALLRDFRSRRALAPSLDRPAGAVGASGTWTGTAAERLHRDELAPASQSIPRAIERAERAIADELSRAERALGRAESDARETSA